MTGSCPVSARVCQETARERDELANWKNRATHVLDALALWKAEALRERDDLQAELERLRSAADSLLRKALERAARGQVPAVNVVEIGEAFGERPAQPTEGES